MKATGTKRITLTRDEANKIALSLGAYAAMELEDRELFHDSMDLMAAFSTSFDGGKTEASVIFTEPQLEMVLDALEATRNSDMIYDAEPLITKCRVSWEQATEAITTT